MRIFLLALVFVFLNCNAPIHSKDNTNTLSHILSLHKHYLNTLYSSQGIPMEIESLSYSNEKIHIDISYSSTLAFSSLTYFEKKIQAEINKSLAYFSQTPETIQYQMIFKESIENNN